MHTDDHILETLVAAKAPLPAIAAELRMSFIALIRWMDAHADLIAIAKRAIEDHIKLLSLRAEAAALIDLTNVSTSTPNEERKRKSASQLLRHAAKRLFTNPERKLSAPCASASPGDLLDQPASSVPPNAQWRMPNAVSSPNAASSLLSSCGSAPAIHPPDIVTQAVVAGLRMGMRIPGFTLADCAPP